ncbi:hypothetical protein GGR52DRAFT_593052, partial [Hypoxylon sp. FL1284]
CHRPARRLTRAPAPSTARTRRRTWSGPSRPSPARACRCGRRRRGSACPRRRWRSGWAIEDQDLPRWCRARPQTTEPTTEPTTGTRQAKAGARGPTRRAPSRRRASRPARSGCWPTGPRRRAPSGARPPGTGCSGSRTARCGSSRSCSSTRETGPRLAGSGSSGSCTGCGGTRASRSSRGREGRRGGGRWGSGSWIARIRSPLARLRRRRRWMLGWLRGGMVLLLERRRCGWVYFMRFADFLHVLEVYQVRGLSSSTGTHLAALFGVVMSLLIYRSEGHPAASLGYPERTVGRVLLRADVKRTWLQQG